MRFLAAIAVLAGAIAVAVAVRDHPHRASVASGARAAAGPTRALPAPQAPERTRAEPTLSPRDARDWARRHAIAELRAGSPISAYGGYVAWSAQPRGSDRWALWLWHAGRSRRIDVPTREVPFDVDLGPDAAGRPTAVYSRCAKEPAADPRPDYSSASGCHIHAVTLPDGTERTLGVGTRRGSQTTPSIWRGDVAFAEHLPGALNPRIALWRHASGATRVLPGGDRATHCRRVSPQCGSVVLQLDLGARILAYDWLLRGPDQDIHDGIGPEWELRGDHLDTGRSFDQDDGFISGTCGGLVTDSPAIDAHGFAWLEWPNDCDSPNGGTHDFIVINDFRRKHWVRVEPPPVAYPTGGLYGMARDGETFYWLYGPHTDELSEQQAAGDGCRRHGCWLLRSSHLRFEPVPDPDPIVAGGD
jgi:hypothetical protein